MKFQNPSIHHSKVNTDTQTDTQTYKPEEICPSNLFKVGGINRITTDVLPWDYQKYKITGGFNNIFKQANAY